ncbi:RING-H2 finger protein ATL39-like protein [Carex littledalei]|uniref:RING-type E3 ubiquitin transferase n=1 Tax=Carex littledalei TaxID=544730 RepID=A0A833RHQ7_9POAL|nr:RING-H2 finger protein ATL39-like protein [Carex littledalei]
MSTHNISLAPTPNHHVKTCCHIAATLQIVAITLCAFAILYAIFSSIRCLCRRHIGSHNMPSPPELSGLDPALIATLPMYQYTRQGKGDEPAPDCTICLNDLDEGDAVRLLPVCMHLFHRDCIDLWLEKNNTCPVCRSRVIGGLEKDDEELSHWMPKDTNLIPMQALSPTTDAQLVPL